MTLIRRALILLFCLVPTASVWAVSVNGLYDATVPVPSTSPTDRPAAFAAALGQVLQRVTGSADILQKQGIDDVLKNADQLVQSYRYETVPAPQVTATGGAAAPTQQNGSAPTLTTQAPAPNATPGMPQQTPAPQALEMIVSFGPVGVNKALASAGASVWGANRPQIVVWAALDNDSGRVLITPSAGEWATAFQKAADTWGLPLVLPNYDARDQQAINLSEVWGQFMDSIQQASKPYHADEVVALRLSGAPGSWQASWRMQGADLSTQGDSTADTPADLVSQLAQSWSAQLAQRFAVAPSAVGQVQSVELSIRNVNNLDAYAAVRRALRNMTPIESVEPVSITSGELVLRVQFQGELNVLQQYVALDHRFDALDETTPVGQPSLSVSASQSPATPDVAATNANANNTNGNNASANNTSANNTGTDSTNGSNSGGQMAGSPSAQDATAGDNGAATQNGDNAAAPDTAAFSTLYPRLHYAWRGPSSSTPATAPAPTSNGATAPGASTGQPINAMSTPIPGNTNAGSGSP